MNVRFCQQVAFTDANESVAASESVLQRAAFVFTIGEPQQFFLVFVEIVTALVNCTFGVAHNHVCDWNTNARILSNAAQKFCDRCSSCSRTVDHDSHRFRFSRCDFGTIEQSCQQHDGGSVLIVMENGDAEILQRFFDDETARCRNVFEVNASKNRSDSANGFDDLLSVLRIEANWKRVDVGKLFHQQSFAFHHRNRPQRPDVAQTKHRRTVADDSNRISFDRQVAGKGRVFRDQLTRTSNTWSVGERQIVFGFDGDFADQRNFAAKLPMNQNAAFVNIFLRFLPHTRLLRRFDLIWRCPQWASVKILAGCKQNRTYAAFAQPSQ